MTYRCVQAAIEEQGFAAVASVFTARELAEAEALLDRLMNDSGAAVARLRREMAEQPSVDGFLQPELSRPALLSRKLRQGAVYAKCRAMAEEILGAKPYYLFDHAIYKMPRSATVTPWHQDQAYLGEKISMRSLHFWIPFQDTSEQNGCMRFVPRSQPSLLPHKPVYKNNPHLLGAQFELSQAVHEMVLQKGDVSIHTNLTLHATGANHTDQIRKAWVVHFGDRPAWYKHWLQIKSRLVG